MPFFPPRRFLPLLPHTVLSAVLEEKTDPSVGTDPAKLKAKVGRIVFENFVDLEQNFKKF